MPDQRATRLGFGTYSLTGRSGVAAIESALEIGDRHLDTAHLYDNEDEVLRLDPDDADVRRIDGVDLTHRCEDPDWMAW